MTTGGLKRGAWSGGNLPVDQWPACDAAAWRAALENDDPDERGAAGHLSPDTRHTMQKMYGLLLSWMRLTSRLDPSRSGTDQLSADLVGDYLTAWRAASSDVTVKNGLGSLSCMLRRLAPDRDWTWVCRHRLAPRPRHARAARKKPRIFDVGLLLHRLLAELEKLDQLPWSVFVADRRRDCLIVAISLYTALRRRNLHDLALGSTFLRGSSTWRIRYAAGGSKTGAPILMRLPPVLVPHIDRYIEMDRPRLLGPTRTCPAVWVSRDRRGPALKLKSINNAFTRVGLRLIGRRLSSHQTRYAVATTLQTMNPNAGEITSALLVHADKGTVPEFYDQSDDAVAQAIWRGIKKKIHGSKP